MKSKNYKVFLLKAVAVTAILILVVLFKPPNASSYTIQSIWEGGMGPEAMWGMRDQSGYVGGQDFGWTVGGQLPSGSWAQSILSMNYWENRVTTADGTIVTSFYLQEFVLTAYELKQPLATSFLSLQHYNSVSFSFNIIPDYSGSGPPNVSLTKVETLYADDGVTAGFWVSFGQGVVSWSPVVYGMLIDNRFYTSIFNYDLTAQSGSAGGSALYVFTMTEPIPEPSTILLIGSGLLGLAGYGRKKFFKK